MMFSLKSCSPSPSERGRLPTSTFRSSPVKASPSFLALWSLPRWGRMSVMVNWGSPSFSPMHRVSSLPSLRTTLPCMDRGMAVHWYFLMPP